MKNTLIGLLALLFPLTAALANISLKVGDLLLQPLDCYNCGLIEAEEQSIYSHIGVVLKVEPLIVGEAFGKVRAVSFDEFNGKTEKGQRVAVYRFRSDDAVAAFEKEHNQFMHLYYSIFHGRLYDRNFLWDNFDEQGEEMFYCSEFVAKLFQGFLGIEPPIKRMMFARYPEAWKKYFRGNVPVGKWGNSPADFERSELFYLVGEL